MQGKTTNGKQRSASIPRWIGRIILGAFGLVLCLAVILFVRESIARGKYHAEYPAPGEMVSLRTHAIHLHCVGSGSPTVVFEADLDQYGSLSWSTLLEDVGEFTRACSYDRAGILWSEAGPLPRDGETIANELAVALEAAGERGPYLLVGHAFGGVYVRIFAGQYPEDVYGMVLVDSSHPDMFTHFAEYGLTVNVPDPRIRPLILLLSHLGLPGRDQGNIYDLPSGIYDPVQAYLPESSMAWFDETVAASDTLAQAGEVTDFGDMPLVVLASARSSHEHQAAWVELQQELADLSSNSDFRALDTAGHYLYIDSPEEVIAAIRDVIENGEDATALA